MSESDDLEQPAVRYTPVPDGDPMPMPWPLPDRPIPIPDRWPPDLWREFPPDWWRCLRLGAVSGRYSGAQQQAGPGPILPLRRQLDLRVDIDPRSANSPVMNRISGDFFRTTWDFGRPGQPIVLRRIYQESWIVDNPQVTWSRCSVTITGAVRYWKGVHPATTIRVVISWSNGVADTAEVTFTEAGGATSRFSCTKTSDCFRELTLEVDVCGSVNTPPLLPTYDTHAHNTRPADLPQRVLTFDSAYREAGVCVTLRPDNTLIDDSAAQFSAWSVAELHDAMETHFSQFLGGWPAWEMWGLLAGTFDDPLTGGIMFDAAGIYGGAGEPPDRQGFAVFRNHSWFTNLTDGPPANQNQAWAMRQYLYTWVHEAGHAFNFLHSWDKGRPNALSWMNYPQYVANFWNQFRFRFDDEELIHLRHGDRAAVIPGGDPWASGGHLDAPPVAYLQMEGEGPIELLLRSQGYFEFMEPVTIEVRLRNRSSETPVDIDTRLNPEYGMVRFFIQQPSGRIVAYNPICCRLAEPDIRTLRTTDAVPGEDRHSESVFLSYGAGGFYFDEPGRYLVRAVYDGPGGVVVTSNVLQIRIGQPLSREEDRLAQDFFTYPVGMTLYLGGSQSPFLAEGRDVLNEVVERAGDTVLGAKAATILAAALARPFFRVDRRDETRAVMRKTHDADPAAAVKLTEPAVAVYKNADGRLARALNIQYHKLVRQRAEALAAAGDSAQAKRELNTLQADLKKRGVNEPVLESIDAYAASLGKSRTRGTKR